MRRPVIKKRRLSASAGAVLELPKLFFSSKNLHFPPFWWNVFFFLNHPPISQRERERPVHKAHIKNFILLPSKKERERERGNTSSSSSLLSPSPSQKKRASFGVRTPDQPPHPGREKRKSPTFFIAVCNQNLGGKRVLFTGGGGGGGEIQWNLDNREIIQSFPC